MSSGKLQGSCANVGRKMSHKFRPFVMFQRWNAEVDPEFPEFPITMEDEPKSNTNRSIWIWYRELITNSDRLISDAICIQVSCYYEGNYQQLVGKYSSEYQDFLVVEMCVAEADRPPKVCNERLQINDVNICYQGNKDTFINSSLAATHREENKSQDE